MKASKVIKQLQELVDEHGDVDVEIGHFDYENNSEIGVEVNEIV